MSRPASEYGPALAEVRVIKLLRHALLNPVLAAEMDKPVRVEGIAHGPVHRELQALGLGQPGHSHLGLPCLSLAHAVLAGQHVQDRRGRPFRWQTRTYGKDVPARLMDP